MELSMSYLAMVN